MVSDTGQNLRVNVDTGVATVDLALSGPGVAGAGYTNNDADPNTATTLYDIDTATDQVSIQAPPNNGNLNPIGRLGVDTVVGRRLRRVQRARSTGRPTRSRRSRRSPSAARPVCTRST